MAGVVDPRFSALYGDASKWLEAAPDYDAIIAKVGAADGAGVLAKSACMTALLNLAVRSPTVVAFVLASDPDLIHVGHSCTRYPANISKPSAVDDQFIVLVGDREDSCEPIAIDDDGFSRGAATRCHSVDEIRGNQGHAATPAVLRRASPAGGTAGSAELRWRPVMLLPFEIAGDALSLQPEGSCTLPGFYTSFLETPLASGDAATVARFTPLRDWWRTACTVNSGGDRINDVDTVDPANPRERGQLNTWVTSVKRDAMARIGIGGPTLTDAAFQAGVTDITNQLATNATSIQTTLQGTADAALAFERDRRNVEFADKYGDAVADRVYKWTNATNHATLPSALKIHTCLTPPSSLTSREVA